MTPRPPSSPPAKCCGSFPTPSSLPQVTGETAAISSSPKRPTRFHSSHSVRRFFSRSFALPPPPIPVRTAAPSAPLHLRRRPRPRRPATVRQPTQGRWATITELGAALPSTLSPNNSIPIASLTARYPLSAHRRPASLRSPIFSMRRLRPTAASKPNPAEPQHFFCFLIGVRSASAWGGSPCQLSSGWANPMPVSTPFSHGDTTSNSRTSTRKAQTSRFFQSHSFHLFLNCTIQLHRSISDPI